MLHGVVKLRHPALEDAPEVPGQQGPPDSWGEEGKGGVGGGVRVLPAMELSMCSKVATHTKRIT